VAIATLHFFTVRSKSGWRLPPFIFYGSLEERVAIATLHFYAVYNKSEWQCHPLLFI
jgi:hypothetical protein